jgi:hypothetical protein
MTEPAQARTVKIGYTTTRRYSWPPVEPHEFTVTSVTSALKHGLPKPHLIGWAAKKTAECAVSDHKIVTAMLEKGDKKAALAHLKGSRYRDMTEKGDRGTIVHAAIDSYLSDKPLSDDEIDKRLADAYVPHYMKQSTHNMISGAISFLQDSEPEVFWNEGTVYSRQHGYAGTADIIGSLWVGGSRQPAVVDFKTSAAIYDEVALQLVAYARADFVGLNDGTEAPVTPDGAVPKHGIVVRPKADGTYERVDFVLNDDLFAMFLGCLSVTNGVENDSLAQSRMPTAIVSGKE